MEEKLGISKDTGLTIICKVLGNWKICFRFVLHKQTDKQKAKQIETIEYFITMCDQVILSEERDYWREK